MQILQRLKKLFADFSLRLVFQRQRRRLILRRLIIQTMEELVDLCDALLDLIDARSFEGYRATQGANIADYDELSKLFSK